LDITLNKKTPTEATIKITLKEADYQPKVEEKVKDYSKKANIKGFRPGKVPTSLIRKMYGKSILVDEINHILTRSINEYIKEQKINVLGDPLPDLDKTKSIDWDNQKDFDFEYNIGMVEDIPYDISKKQKVTAYEIKVDDKNIDETIENIQSQFGKMTNPEESAEGDILFGTITNEAHEIEEKTTLDLNSLKKKDLKKFVGLKKDDKIVFDLFKTFDLAEASQMLNRSEDELREIKGDFEFILINVNRREKAELNQELFDQVFGKDQVKDLEGFKTKVTETIKNNYQRETEQFLLNSIRDHLVEKTKIELPDNFLKEWLLVTNENLTKEQIDEEYHLYAKDLKWTLISNKIAEDHEVKVEQDEIREKAKDLIRQQLASSGMAGQLEDNMDAFADNYLSGEDGKNYMQVFNMLRGEKILKKVKEEITISEKKVSMDEFQKLALNA
jgi:trigger factor